MARLVVSEFITLDGVIQDPMWTFDYFTPDMGEYKFNELFSSDSLLLGRVTYDGFAAAWPGREDEQGYADRINSMRKYLVSTTRESGDWENTVVINDNVVDEVNALKAQEGGDILVFGSGELVQTLLANDLVDILSLQVYPLIIGNGQRLFTSELAAKFELVSVQQIASGVLIMHYAPKRVEAAE